MPSLRAWMACVLAGCLLTALGSCGTRVPAAATHPLSPADGAADYKDRPGGPHERPLVPGAPSENVTKSNECPPRCGPDGAWFGCNLSRPRGTACVGCEPQCRNRGEAEEGWYDCAGVLIVKHSCS